jgi:hypothetical protein
MKLHTNMRVQQLLQQGDTAAAQDQQSFAAFLVRVGDGNEPTVAEVGADYIHIPDRLLCCGTTLQDLVRDVFGDLEAVPAAQRSQHIVERAILTPLNDKVDEVRSAFGVHRTVKGYARRTFAHVTALLRLPACRSTPSCTRR